MTKMAVEARKNCIRRRGTELSRGLDSKKEPFALIFPKDMQMVVILLRSFHSSSAKAAVSLGLMAYESMLMLSQASIVSGQQVFPL